jgi:hypothetical protein
MTVSIKVLWGGKLGLLLACCAQFRILLPLHDAARVVKGVDHILDHDPDSTIVHAGVPDLLDRF